MNGNENIADNGWLHCSIVVALLLPLIIISMLARRSLGTLASHRISAVGGGDGGSCCYL